MSSNKLNIINNITGGSPNRLRETFFKKNNIEIYDKIMKFTSNIDVRFPFRIWHWVNNEKDYIKCYCGNMVSENMNWKDGYKKYCSNKCSANSEITKKKLKKTCLERYGVEHYSKTNEYLDKIISTSLKKWGVTNYSKTNEYIIKSKKTYSDKYGVDNYTKTQEYLDKSKKTSLCNWGVEFPTQSDIIKSKIRETNIKKYGNSHIFMNNDYRDVNFMISKNEYYIGYYNGYNKFNCDFGFDHVFEISTDDYYGRIKSNNKLCTVCNTISSQSSLKEIMLYEFIKSVYDGDIIQSYRDSLEIDIYLPELKIGFEFNGLYWHSEKFKYKNYHINKTNHFKDKGIRIIHIWEDDWCNKRDILESQIKNWIGISKNKIYARKCIVKEITDIKKVRDFLDSNHIQGFDKSKLKLGLFYDDEMVAVMTFNKFEGRNVMVDDSWNLSRFCNSLNVNVVGGASKLLKYFIRVYSPNRVVSYADTDWSDGGLYNKLGFILVNKNNPDYKYVIKGNRIHKSRFRKSRLPNNVSETSYMYSIGIYKIWDCGKMKFEYITPIKINGC